MQCANQAATTTSHLIFINKCSEKLLHAVLEVAWLSNPIWSNIPASTLVSDRLMETDYKTKAKAAFSHEKWGFNFSLVC